jgi:hypothetical protein
VVYQQELARAAGALGRPVRALADDPRGKVPVSLACHGAHHARQRPLPLHVLPDQAFVFAEEVLGAGPASVYLERRYSGGDPRLDAMSARA